MTYETFIKTDEKSKTMNLVFILSGIVHSICERSLIYEHWGLVMRLKRLSLLPLLLWALEHRNSLQTQQSERSHTQTQLKGGVQAWSGNTALAACIVLYTWSCHNEKKKPLWFSPALEANVFLFFFQNKREWWPYSPVPYMHTNDSTSLSKCLNLSRLAFSQ